MYLIESTEIKKIFESNPHLKKYQDLSQKDFKFILDAHDLLPKNMNERPSLIEDFWRVKVNENTEYDPYNEEGHTKLDVYGIFKVLPFFQRHVDTLEYLDISAKIEVVPKDLRYLKQIIEIEFKRFNDYFTKNIGEIEKIDVEKLIEKGKRKKF